jgi:hypothetical protein
VDILYRAPDNIYILVFPLRIIISIFSPFGFYYLSQFLTQMIEDPMKGSWMLGWIGGLYATISIVLGVIIPLITLGGIILLIVISITMEYGFRIWFG